MIDQTASHAHGDVAPRPAQDPSTPRIFLEESRALPLVNIAVAIRSGASSDPVGKEGLTRIMVRMLRRGCRGMASHEFEEKIDSLGAEISADVSSSVITVHADVISRSLDALVDLLGTMMGEPTFDEVELGKLRRETEGEIIEVRDNDRALATRHFRRVVFENHSYGRRVGGTIPSISSITVDDVRAHHKLHFTRGNVALAFSGEVSEARAAEITARLVAKLPAGRASVSTITAPDRKSKRRLVFVDKPERTQTQILMGEVGSHPRDPDHIALHVSTTIFGGTFTSRMMKAIRSERGWSYGAYARLPYDKQRDAFSMWTFPAAKDAAACIALELDLLQSWRDKGITAGELAFAKRYLVRSHAFDIDTPQKRVHQRLDVDLFDLPPDYHENYIANVQAVTLEQANEATRSRVSADDLVVSVVGTHAEIGEGVANAVPGLGNVEVVAYDSE